MPYYVFGNGTIVTPEWLNDIQTRIYNPDTGEYRQWLDADLSDSPGQIKDKVAMLNNELKVFSTTGLYANYKGGQIRDILGNPITISDGSVLCADNTTNYICVDKTGVVFVSTFATKLTLAKVTLSSGQLVSLTDLRAKYLVFDPSDVQTVISPKSSNFTAENNGFYIIAPSNDIIVTLPTNLDSCQFSLLILPNSYIVKTNETATVNELTTSYILTSGKLYNFILTVNGWYCYSIILDGQLKTTILNDMPSSLIAGKILKVNSAGTKYELVEAKTDNWVVTSSNYSANNNEKILTTQSAPISINLPGSPNTGSFIELYGNFSTNNVTVNRNGNTISNGINQVVLSTTNTLNRFIYSGSTWVTNADVGAISSETAQGTAGQQGTVTSLYTSTLISDAFYGSCAVVNAATNLCLIAYVTNNNTTKIMPGVFNGSLIFTFYKPVEWAEISRDIKIIRVSDTQAIVSYYIPSSDTVAVKLIEVSTLGCVVKSQINITSATNPKSSYKNTQPSVGYYEAYSIGYNSSQVCIQTLSQIKLLQITNSTFSVLYQGNITNGYVPGSNIFYNNYWYVSFVTSYPYTTGTGTFQFTIPNINIINSSGNLIFSAASTDSTPSFLFQNQNTPSLVSYYSYYYTNHSYIAQSIIGPYVALAGSNWGYCYPRTLTTSTPYFTGTNAAGSTLYYPALGGVSTQNGLRASQTGNTIWLMDTSATKVATGFINSSGILSMSNFSNLLGLSTPSATFGYFGVVSSSQFGIVSNGFVAIVNV